MKATGTPIKLGAIATDQPGVVFTDVPDMTKAYFDCVNANGGVNGHPIQYFIQTEQTQPSQIEAEANKLVQTHHVLGMVGDISVIECTVNQPMWQKLGFYEIDAGVAEQCNSTPNSATINMGPRYSSDGAVQYALTKHVSKIVFDNPILPNITYVAAGPQAIATAAHVPFTLVKTALPIQDANSIAIRDTTAAGSNGAVVLDHSPPQALQILQAAQKLGLENRVKVWACSTPCNTDFLAQALGPKWEGKLFVNSELAPPDVTDTPTMRLYKAVLKQYGKAVTGGVGSFSEMGFGMGEIAVHALETIKGAYTVKSVNAAFKNVANFNTGLLCKPWTYGPYASHIPNNVDYTVTRATKKWCWRQDARQSRTLTRR